MGRRPPKRPYRKRKPGTQPAAPAFSAGGRLAIRQIRSGSGQPAAHRRTLEALGLKHHQDVVVKRDHAALRGMIAQVRHLVEVTSAKEGER